MRVDIQKYNTQEGYDLYPPVSKLFPNDPEPKIIRYQQGDIVFHLESQEFCVVLGNVDNVREEMRTDGFGKVCFSEVRLATPREIYGENLFPYELLEKPSQLRWKFQEILYNLDFNSNAEKQFERLMGSGAIKIEDWDPHFDSMLIPRAALNAIIQEESRQTDFPQTKKMARNFYNFL
jgi:hypothetical protein